MPGWWLTFKKLSAWLQSQLVDVGQRIIPKEINYLIIEVKAFPKGILINVQCTIFMNGTLGAHKSMLILVSIMGQVSFCPFLPASLLEIHQPQFKRLQS